MSAVTIALQAARVERDGVQCGCSETDPATQTLRFYDERDVCTLVMTLVWPHGAPAGAVVLRQDRHDGARV